MGPSSFSSSLCLSHSRASAWSVLSISNSGFLRCGFSAPLIIDLIFEVLLKLNREKMTIFLVEQNVQLSLEVARRAYVLEHGRIILQGASKDLQENEAVKRAYLGI